MILLKTILESISDSKRGTMIIGVNNEPQQKYYCLLSPNTRERELPYRLTWFRPDDMSPAEHYDMDRPEYEVMKNNHITPRLLRHLDSSLGTIKKLEFNFN